MKIVPSIWPVPFFVAFFASDLMIYATLAGEVQSFFLWNRTFTWLFPACLLTVIAIVRLLIRRALARRLSR